MSYEQGLMRTQEYGALICDWSWEDDIQVYTSVTHIISTFILRWNCKKLLVGREINNGLYYDKIKQKKDTI